MPLTNIQKNEFESALPLIKHMMRRFSNGKNLDEDFLQSVYAEVIQKGLKFDSERGASFASYLGTCTKYSCLNQHLRRKKEVIFNTLDGEDKVCVELEPEIERKEIIKLILEAVLALEPIEKQIIELKFWGNKSFREIYKIFNKKISKNYIEDCYKNALLLLEKKLYHLKDML